MFKKFIGLFVAIVMGVVMSVSASAESNNYNNIHEISQLSSTRSNDYSYGDFSISNGSTALLSNSNDYFFIKPSGNATSVTVTLITHLSSNQNNIDMGYYNNSTYTECNWSKTSSLFGGYTYTCTMTLTRGYYKFFISNNTANSLTFTGTTISF